MNDSLTLTLSENSLILKIHYFPPIELTFHQNYFHGLVEVLTFNSIPNVAIGRNKLFFSNEVITIPIGSYKINDMIYHVQKVLE